MGIIGRFFLQVAGNLVGFYVAQKYLIPYIEEDGNNFLDWAKEMEKKYHKPNKKDDD